MITTECLDSWPIHFQNATLGAIGVWESISVSYPFVDVELTLDLNGSTEKLWGGACPAQR